jgi:cellulose synthase/poly-beta-1,6-N-acetylglucosamine synthase-like glycosyltransferase
LIMPVSNIPKVSIIVPTYNREELLCNTIKYLLDQDFFGYEILVIDQSKEHTFETIKFLRKVPSYVKVITHQPPSLTLARNKGILEARGEIIVMVDDDVILKKDFISQHLKYYSNPSIVGVAGRVEVESRFINKPPAFLKSNFTKWISYYEFQGKAEKNAYRMAGGNSSFRKACAFRAGLFDENFIGTAWGEDYDFSLRLKNDRHKIMYSPDAAVFHLAARDGGCGSRNRFDFYTVYSKSHNLAYLIEKNRINRLTYVYLVLYIYIQLFIKKQYFTFRGLFFLLKGNLLFIRGFVTGFKKGRKKALTIFKTQSL